MCPLNISLITDYDAGLEGEVEPVSHNEVMKVFANNIHNLKDLLFKLIENLPADCNCNCDKSLENTRG